VSISVFSTSHVSNEELQMSMSILLSRLPYLLIPYPYENLWCKLFALGNNLPALRRLLGCNPSTGFPPPTGTDTGTGTGTNNASPLLLCEHSANEVDEAVLLPESGTSQMRRSADDGDDVDDDDNSAETTGGIYLTAATTAATSTSTSTLPMVAAESFCGGSALEPVPGTVLAALCALRAAATPGTAAGPPRGTGTGTRNRTLYLGATVRNAMVVSSDSYSDSGIAESPRASHQHHHHHRSSSSSSSSPGCVVVSAGGRKKQKQYRYDEK
jgi:hypothetical protein